MKFSFLKHIVPATALLLSMGLGSCVNDLDVTPIDPSTNMTPDYDGLFAKCYANMAVAGNGGANGDCDVDGLDGGTTGFIRQLWNANELTTDEAMCCWGDEGIPAFNYNQWGASHPMLRGYYNRLYIGVTFCNFYLTEAADYDATMTAEIRFLRALYYYYLMDGWGNIPFLTALSSEAAPQASRKEVYDFIEKELLECEADMTAPLANTYGRADKAAAWMLLCRLALLVCVKTFDKLGWDRKGIIGVTMPGFGTTDRTHTNAVCLMNSLGVTLREVSIKKACLQHFEDIGHDSTVHDVVYENSQARERTQLLMDIANQTWGLVIGTGDLSELALGWATYNGDHMSMYGVNASVPKTLVRHLVTWVAEHDVDMASRATLLDIVDTPISPELIPADEQGNIKQITEDLVGPYELHDFFLYYFMRCGFRPAKIFFLATNTFRGVYDDATIRKWLKTFCRRFFNQQFKRSCLPDGPKVGSISISPRGDWRMPSDASSDAWLRELED